MSEDHPEEKLEVKPPAEPPAAPAHLANDWSFFLEQLNGENKMKPPACFDKETWKVGEVYHMRVSNVYDPSHFWVVTKVAELDFYHKYLQDFYSKYKTHYKIPLENFKLKMYCISYTDGTFCRSILVNLPLEMKQKSWAIVYLIDFGYTGKVPLEEIYFMTKGMYSVPHFAIRACLACLGPVNLTSWSPEILPRFSELVNNKLLLGQVITVNHVVKVIFIRLGEYNYTTKEVDSVSDTLIMENLARIVSMKDLREMKYTKTKKGQRVKVQFLLPPFVELENGTCVDSLAAANFLQVFK